MRACTKMPESKEQEEDGNLSLYGLRKGNKRNENKEEKKKGFFPDFFFGRKCMRHTETEKEEGKKENSFLKIGTPALEIGDGTIKRG